jgi:DNA mismatch repair ATPase MutL
MTDRRHLQLLRPDVISAIRSDLTCRTFSDATRELVSNAIDACSGAGAITVRLDVAAGFIQVEVSEQSCMRGEEATKAECMQSSNKLPWPPVRSQDNGHGISREDMARVGERYCTSKVRDLRDFQQGPATLGYRGEALATLKDACSLLRVTSRQAAASPCMRLCPRCAWRRKEPCGAGL